MVQIQFFSTITSAGGGGGSNFRDTANGGSWWFRWRWLHLKPVGVGNTPPVSPAQGTKWWRKYIQLVLIYGAGGGGGATAVGGMEQIGKQVELEEHLTHKFRLMEQAGGKIL